MPRASFLTRLFSPSFENTLKMEWSNLPSTNVFAWEDFLNIIERFKNARDKYEANDGSATSLDVFICGCAVIVAVTRYLKEGAVNDRYGAYRRAAGMKASHD